MPQKIIIIFGKEVKSHIRELPVTVSMVQNVYKTTRKLTIAPLFKLRDNALLKIHCYYHT